MITRTAFVLAFFGAAALWASASLAEGALAISMPGGNPANGFRWNKNVNQTSGVAASVALNDCRAATNPKVAAACTLIGTFRDQCVAVAVNGDAANTDQSVIAAGWAIAPTRPVAIDRAVAQCEVMRRGRRAACQVEGKVLCDGRAQ